MIRSLRSRPSLFLILMAALCGPLFAQGYGRLALTLVDEQDNPLEGVEVTVTCDELPDFREVDVTNKKGRVNFAFVDATQTYSFEFKLDGYNPTSTRIKPEIRTTSRRTFILEKAGTSEPTPEGRIVYTPAETVFNEGVALLKDADLAAAKLKFQQALELEPGMMLAHSALAGIYLEEQDYESAIASAGVVVAAEPSSPRGHRILYQAHKALGNEAEAEDAFDTLKQLGAEGDTVATIYNEGVAALRVGDATSAKARFLEALELDPELPAAHSALAILYGNEGSYEKAVSYAEKALAHDPDNATMQQIRYDGYRALGDEAKAQEAFDKLAASNPKALADKLYNQATEAFNAGETAEAAATYAQVLQADPERARAHYQLGLCYVNLDDKPKAREHLAKFLEMAPDDPEADAARSMLEYLK